jgi:hypothetical protein
VESLDYAAGNDPVPERGSMRAIGSPGQVLLTWHAKNDDRIRCASCFPGSLETSLPGSFHEGALLFMGQFQPYWISMPTGTDALQMALDPGKPGIFSVYNYA